MQVITNFRDFGGQLSIHGGRVARDLMYRCGQLRSMSEAQLRYLAGWQFSLVVDLRHGRERRRVPVPWMPADATTVLTLPEHLEGEAPHRALLRAGPASVADVDRFYLALYRRLPFDPPYRDLFALAMHSLLGTAGRSLVYCTAGKDRTGMLVALIQSVLGVRRADILADYLESNRSAELAAQSERVVADVGRRLGYQLSEAAARRLMGVEPAYLESALTSIEEHCGSIDAYFDQLAFGAGDRERLRRKLLVGPP